VGRRGSRKGQFDVLMRSVLNTFDFKGRGLHLSSPRKRGKTVAKGKGSRTWEKRGVGEKTFFRFKRSQTGGEGIDRVNGDHTDN